MGSTGLELEFRSHPTAGQRGPETWGRLAAYAAEEWYPSRVAFGKHKGQSIAERCPAGSRGFQAPDDTRHGIVAERRLRRMRRSVIKGGRRSATRAVWGADRGLKAPATGGASLRDGRRRYRRGSLRDGRRRLPPSRRSVIDLAWAKRSLHCIAISFSARSIASLGLATRLRCAFGVSLAESPVRME